MIITDLYIPITILLLVTMLTMWIHHAINGLNSGEGLTTSSSLVYEKEAGIGGELYTPKY